MTAREIFTSQEAPLTRSQKTSRGYSLGVHSEAFADTDFSVTDNAQVGYQWLKDTVNERSKFKDNPFYSERATRAIASMKANVEFNKRLAYDDIDDLFITDKSYFEVIDTPPYAAYSPSMSDDAFITLAAANTNPSAAEFDAPIFLAELKDIPKLFQNAATKLTKAGANEYLKFEYGWKPLLRDMDKFTKTMDKLDRRIQTLSRLQDQGRVRRRYDPPTGYERIQTGPSYGDPIFSGSSIRALAMSDISIKRWVDVIWVADPLVGAPRTDQQLRRKAQQAMLGGKLDGSTMWELMPWSWMIDWSTNMSEYISSHRNIVGAKVESCTLMKTTIITSVGSWTFDPSDYPNLVDYELQSSYGNSIYIIKERIPGQKPETETTNVFAPILGSETKSSILGALSMQRLRRMQLF